MFWIYRGFWRGLYPALNMFLVFLLALLVTLNYYGLAFSLVGKIAPKVDLKMKECISFAFTYLVSFGVLLYFCLWLCAENMKIHSLVDMIGGGIFGLAGGVLCSGVAMIFWFSTPFSTNFPIDDNEMFYRPNEWSLAMATQIGRRIPGGRPFSGVRFMRDVRYGLPGIPSIGSGVYVASVPNGLRIFDCSRHSPTTAVMEVAKYLGRTGETIAPSEKREAGDIGRTPMLIDGSSSNLIAVVDDRNRGLGNVPSEFVADGAVGFATKKSLEQEIVIRLYRVEQVGPVASVIALFQPAEVWRDVDEVVETMQELLPSRECYNFDTDEMLTALIESAVPDTDAKRLIPLLRHGGKICFAGAGNVLTCAEVMGDENFRVFRPDPPEDLDETIKARKEREQRRR